MEGEVVFAGQAGLVNHGAVDKELHAHGEIIQRCAGEGNGLVLSVAIVIAVRLFARPSRFEPGAALGDLDGVDGEVALVVVEN